MKSKKYTAGVKAMYDYLTYRAANNFHGNPETNKQCDIENEIIISWAGDALEECDEFAYDEWLKIKSLNDEIAELERQLLELTLKQDK